MTETSQGKGKSRFHWLRRLIPVAIVAGAVALVALVAMTPAKDTRPAPVEAVPVNVTVETIRPVAEVAESFDLPGVVEPNRVVKVSAEVAGQIESYGKRAQDASWGGRVFAKDQPVDEGQPVQEGDLLVHLNKDILQAARDQADAQYQYDQNEHQRLLDLRQRGAATAREVDAAATKLAVSKATLKTAQEHLNRATIRAPIRGILNCLRCEVGEYVQPGACVAEIVDVDPVKVVLDVPERDVSNLAVGAEERILLGANGQQVLTGQISFISELADPQTRASRVEISVPNPRHLLRSGQILTVRLTRKVLRDVVLIPLEAVIPLEEGRQVYVVEDGKAEPRKVELGFFQGAKVQALSGLKAGDALIVKGNRYVSAGQAVKVVPP